MNCSDNVVNSKCCETCRHRQQQQQQQHGNKTTTVNDSARRKKSEKSSKKLHRSKKLKQFNQNKSLRKLPRPDTSNEILTSLDRTTSVIHYINTTGSSIADIVSMVTPVTVSTVGVANPTMQTAVRNAKRRLLKHMRNRNVSSAARKLQQPLGDLSVVNTTSSLTSSRSCSLGDRATFCSNMPREDCYRYSQLCCETCAKHYSPQPGTVIF